MSRLLLEAGGLLTAMSRLLLEAGGIMTTLSRLLEQAGGTLSVLSHLPAEAGGTAPIRSPTPELAVGSVKHMALHWLVERLFGKMPGWYIAPMPQIKLRSKPSIRHEEPRPAPGELEILRALMNSKENGDGNPEELTSPEDLASWLSSRDLLPEEVPLNDDDLKRAVWLRWAFRSLVFSKGEEGEREVGIIRQVGETIPFRLVFENGLEPRFEPSGTEVMQAFGRLIQLFVDARCEDRWRRFKVCGHCREIFYDHTHNRAGRWCRTRCGEAERKKVSRRRRRTGRV